MTLLLLYNPLRPDPTKWSKTPKQLLLLINCFYANSRQIVLVFLSISKYRDVSIKDFTQ